MLLVRDDLYVRHVNRVMVTVDGTGVGVDVEPPVSLSTDPGGTLTGVHVVRQKSTPTRGGEPAPTRFGHRRSTRSAVELKPMTSFGNDIGRAVCATAIEANADLVVIASQDRRPLVARGLVDLDKLLGGSVSDYIRVHAPAPSCWSGNRARMRISSPDVGLDVQDDQEIAGTRMNRRLATNRDRWFPWPRLESWRTYHRRAAISSCVSAPSSALAAAVPSSDSSSSASGGTGQAVGPSGRGA